MVEAYDRRKRVQCAIKIIRSVQKYRDASRIELRVLSTLASNDRENRNKCIHLRDCFDFRNHICIVTDLLGQSVFDFLKSNQFTPFPNSHIQSFARQLFTSVACESSSEGPPPGGGRGEARDKLSSGGFPCSCRGPMLTVAIGRSPA